MEVDLSELHEHLSRVDVVSWDSPLGRSVLEAVRTRIVCPAVRRSGLRGAAADQAEASAWAAAWDALRRPSARLATNPAGMAWVAARRAIAQELAAGDAPGSGGPPLGLMADGASDGSGWEIRSGSLDPEACGESQARVAHWELGSTRLGPAVETIVEALVEAGWRRALAEDAIVLLAEHAVCRAGRPEIPWRTVAEILGTPHWQMRRLAILLVGPTDGPGLVALVSTHGVVVLDDPLIRAAIRSTTRKWAPGPESVLCRRATARVSPSAAGSAGDGCWDG